MPEAPEGLGQADGGRGHRGRPGPQAAPDRSGRHRPPALQGRVRGDRHGDTQVGHLGVVVAVFVVVVAVVVEELVMVVVVDGGGGAVLVVVVVVVVIRYAFI